jgi:hypothetical protein
MHVSCTRPGRRAEGRKDGRTPFKRLQDAIVVCIIVGCEAEMIRFSTRPSAGSSRVGGQKWDGISGVFPVIKKTI